MKFGGMISSTVHSSALADFFFNSQQSGEIGYFGVDKLSVKDGRLARQEGPLSRFLFPIDPFAHSH